MDGNPDTKTSYAHTDTGVKQVILIQADPETARSLCQADNRHREICRDNLPIQEKTRICLGNDNDAAECDLIPMFSQRQFFALIPKNIEIFPEDNVQLTHQFYSQQYKLPTEGYSLAIYKAKMLNTICAITRPQFLLTDVARQLKLPPYIDTSLLDDVVRDYVKNFQDNPNPEAYFEITINSKNSRRRSCGIQINYYRGESDLGPSVGPPNFMSFVLSILGEDLVDEFTRIARVINNDEYLKPLRGLPTVYSNELYLSISKPINAFTVSRVVKILFDEGYYHEVVVTTIGDNLEEVTRFISSDASLETLDSWPDE